MSSFKPMLAANIEDVTKLKFPLLASVKLDGVRAIVVNGVLLSRSLKPIRNKHTQQKFSMLPQGLDGELCVGLANDPNLMQKTTSGVMSFDGEPDVRFHVFDRVDGGGYESRMNTTREFFSSFALPDHVTLLEQKTIYNLQELAEFEEKVLSEGYEGVILRKGNAPYKHGRSTFNEGYLMKLKRWTDDEAVVTGFEEQMHNANKLEKDELGHAKRSGHKENMIPKGTLGAVVGIMKDGRTARAGSGFTDALRHKVWTNQADYLGTIFTFKHFTQTGVKDAPRQGIFKAFRDKDDM